MQSFLYRFIFIYVLLGINHLNIYFFYLQNTFLIYFILLSIFFNVWCCICDLFFSMHVLECSFDHNFQRFFFMLALCFIASSTVLNSFTERSFFLSNGNHFFFLYFSFVIRTKCLFKTVYVLVFFLNYW